MVSPKIAEADASREDTSSVQSRNDSLASKVAVLAKQFAELDASKAELAGLEVGIPTRENGTAFLATINELATLHQVTVVNVTPNVPVAVVPPEAAEEPVPVPPATEGATDEGDDEPSEEPTAIDGSVTPTAHASVDAVVEGFATVPFSLTVVGSYANTVAFLNDLQIATPRLVLVSAVNIVSQPEAPALEGRPATAAGDIETVVVGNTYVLVNPLTLAEELLAGLDAEPTPLPLSETPRFFPLPDPAAAAPTGP